MTEVPEDEIKVDITLGHVGRHCILHALTVIEAAISQVCLYVCVCLSLSVCTRASMYIFVYVYARSCVHTHDYSKYSMIHN